MTADVDRPPGPGERAGIFESSASRAPVRPAIHVSAPTGWLNDPNGLCFDGDRWHAFYQHDPDIDQHGTMHWGHATSQDLVHWRDHLIALSPDALGAIFSGSIVLDDADTAGFGPGAMVAAFTHHTDDYEHQSLAYSLDRGVAWQKYAHNPVLVSDERDFRDPKIIRYGRDAHARWVMSLAVGKRIEFYGSDDLRNWHLTGSYTTTLASDEAWECPDLLEFERPDGSSIWVLLFSVADIGLRGHGGTLAVIGNFDGSAFVSDALPVQLDDGPDFYAAQSFYGLAPGTTIAMGWMSNWQYARTHPSAGRRGVLSFPRRIGLDDAGLAITMTPAVSLASLGTPIPGTTWSSQSGRALHVSASGDIVVVVRGMDGVAAEVTITGGSLSVWRREELQSGHDGNYSAPIANDGPHEIIIDHGTVEVFSADGTTALSVLTFPGERWTVELEGDATLTTI